MKVDLRKLMIGVVVIGILVLVFFSGRQTDNWEQKRFEKSVMPTIELKYDMDSGFTLTPPEGRFIQVDTANQMIYVIDSLWLDRVNK